MTIDACNTVSGLLDCAGDEVLRRVPGYFASCPAVICLPDLAARYQQRPPFQRWPADRISARLQEALREFIRRRIVFKRDPRRSDPVSEMLLDSAMDAFAADDGELGLRAPAVGKSSATRALAEGFDECRLPSGTRYFIGRRGAIPLVLINAVGISCATWAKLLADDTHPFRPVLVESRSTRLESGGLNQYVDVEADAEDIARVLEQEKLSESIVLAWCNGARIALKFVSEQMAGLRSLVLLCPTIRGCRELEHCRSEFEATFEYVFSRVTQSPGLANFLSAALRPAEEPNFADFADDGAARAANLFRLPAREYAGDLYAPVASGESLIYYAQRTEADRRFDIRKAMSQVRCPVLLITGKYDGIVSNELTLSAMNAAGMRATHFEVDGAGHYIHDLQYVYLRMILESSLQNKRALPNVNRISINIIGSGRARE